MTNISFAIENKPELNKRRLVHGVGVNDYDKSIWMGDKPIPEYILWKEMLRRCHCQKWMSKAYSNVNCSEDWLYFSNFINDIKQIENYQKFLTEKWHLDKDILCKGNKTYSKKKVCFVPKEINNLFTKREAARGEFPIGVTKIAKNGRFRSQIGKFGKNLYIGEFDTADQAYLAYKAEKEKYIKEVAEQWRGIIAQNVYLALTSYTVSIDD